MNLRTAYEKTTNEQRLPAYVALFARAFPTFGTLTLNYKYVDLQLDDDDFLYILDSAGGAALGLSGAMLGYRSGLNDSNDKLLVFAQSIDFDIKPFTAFLSYAEKEYMGNNTKGHAVSIEWIQCFNGVIESKSFGEGSIPMQKDDIWWYNIKRCRLDDRISPPATEAMKQEVKELRKQLDIDENDERITYRPKPDELRRAIHLLDLLDNDEPAGYVMVQDTNNIGEFIDEKQRCHWIIPLKQLFKIGSHMIIPVTKNTRWYEDDYKPFQYRADDFVDWKNVSAVQQIEKDVYKTSKILSEAEIDVLLSKGYKEWRVYNNGNTIKTGDYVRIVSSDTTGFVEHLNGRKQLVSVRVFLEDDTTKLTYFKPSEIEFISADSGEDSDVEDDVEDDMNNTTSEFPELKL